MWSAWKRTFCTEFYKLFDGHIELFTQIPRLSNNLWVCGYHSESGITFKKRGKATPEPTIIMNGMRIFSAKTSQFSHKPYNCWPIKHKSRRKKLAVNLNQFSHLHASFNAKERLVKSDKIPDERSQSSAPSTTARLLGIAFCYRINSV